MGENTFMTAITSSKMSKRNFRIKTTYIILSTLSAKEVQKCSSYEEMNTYDKSASRKIFEFLINS